MIISVRCSSDDQSKMSRGGLTNATDLQSREGLINPSVLLMPQTCRAGEVLSMPRYYHYVLAKEPWAGVSDHLIYYRFHLTTRLVNHNL